MNLFQLGSFTLNSGAKAKWKIECDALTDDDVAGLAEMIRQMTSPFRCVFGVPRGGVRLEKALQPFIKLSSNLTLIVDDVLTTGGSMERFAMDSGFDLKIVTGAVIFARGRCPSWIKPIFQMPECFWLKH